MSIQAEDPDPYSGLSKPPVFSRRESDYTKSQQEKPLGHVYYNEEDENAPLLSQSVHAGFNSETGGEDTKFKKRRWRSIYVMYFTMFIASLSFSVVISSIWPFLLQIDYVNASTKFLGWVVASYSFGQLVASPVFGLWADIRPTREPLVTAFAINIVFNVLYSYLGAFEPGVAGWVMIASRTLVGFGAGIGAVTRSYVSEATTTAERIGSMAAIGACQALGFIVGPVLGLAFVPLGSDGVEIPAIRFQLNMYTGPGFLSAILGVVNVFLFIFFFKETRLVDRKSKKEEKRRKKELKEHQEANVSDSVLLPAPKQQCFDIFAATASIVIFFVILSGFSVYETLLSPLTMDEFAWTRKQTVLYNNIFFAALSVLTIITLFSVKLITKKVDERVVLMFGMFLLSIAFFVIIPMGSDPPKVLHISSLIDADPIGNVSVVPFSSLTNTNETIEQVGCRYPPQMWCPEIPRIYFAQLMISLIIITPGYASTSVTIFTIYSKVLGPVRQGVMMGLLTAAGSLARALGPMGFSALYEHFGPYVTFSTIVGIFATTIVFILICSPRLIPYDRYVKGRIKVAINTEPA